MFTESNNARGKGMTLQLIITAPMIIPAGAEIPFNTIFQDNTRTRWRDGRGRSFVEPIMRFRLNSTRVLTRCIGRYECEGKINIAPAATNVITLTDNEGQDCLNSLEYDTVVNGGLFIDEGRGTISLRNDSGVPITLTPSATNPQTPVAQLTITYEGR